MPLRHTDTETTDEILDELGATLAAMAPAELVAFVETLHDPADVDLVERAISRVAAVGVRSDPAALANHLTGGEYNQWAYIRLISGRIAAAWRREVSRFQILNMPSQYGKTTLVGNWTPIWLLDQDPTLRVMYVTYDANKAVEEGGKTRDLIDEHSADLNFELRPDKRARGMWSTPQGGGMYCVGIGGGITGWPADVVLCDDLIKGWEAAHSEAQRARVWAIYRTQIRMRSQGARTIFIVAGTRWHEADIFHSLIKSSQSDPAADQFEILRLPAIAEAHHPDDPDPTLREPDPLGRAPGEILEPERFDQTEVMAKRALLGSYLATAIEQQRPAPEEGGEIQRSWWKWTSSPPRRFDDSCSSWDMKLKDKETSDFVVGQIWGRVGSRFWCLDQLRGSWSQPVTKVAIATFAVRYPWVRTHYVENTGNGPEVIAELKNGQRDYVLRDEIADVIGITADERPAVQAMMRRGVSGIVGVNVKGSKAVRLRAVSGRIEGGDLSLIEGAEWAAQLVGEAAAFPNGTTDDSVDALSQALSKLTRGSTTIAVPQGSTPKQAGIKVPRTIGRRS